MYSADLPEVSLRIRHLDAVKGRHFVVNTDPPDATGVFFAISLLGPEDFGYFYVSSVSENLIQPEWDVVDLGSCPQWILASKGALFTFFAVRGDTNSVLFEMTVYFSGLLGIDFEVHNTHVVPNSYNEVYFQFNGNFYSPPNYLLQATCSHCLSSKSPPRTNPKPSYDFDDLQKFMVHSQIMQNQMCRMTQMTQSMNILQGSLMNILSKEEERDALLVKARMLRSHLKAAESNCNNSRHNLVRLSEQCTQLGETLNRVTMDSTDINNRLTAVCGMVHHLSSHMAKLELIVSCRIAQLIRQLVAVFGTELTAAGSKQTVPVDNLDEEVKDVTRHFAFVPVNSTEFDELGVDSSNRKPPLEMPLPSEQNSNAPNHNSPVKLVSLVDADFISAGSKLGLIAQLVRFVSVVLDHPLRYPILLQEGTSRGKVTDHLAQDLFEGERNFPLYLTRASLLPVYKHAVSLLNRDLVDLRAVAGLPTAIEETTAWNLCTLLQYCASEKFRWKV